MNVVFPLPLAYRQRCIKDVALERAAYEISLPGEETERFTSSLDLVW